MDFKHKKLPVEAAENMRLCAIKTVTPFALMLAPVYVFMKRNEKYVSVKGPLDFFTPEELQRLLPMETFYLPRFVDQTIVYRDVGRRIRALLEWSVSERITNRPKHSLVPIDNGQVALPPAPFEVSDAVLRLIGTLWGAELSIEPFFTSILASEICEPLPSELMLRCRDQNVQAFERGLLASGLGVFLALHLGFCDLSYLSKLRKSIFQDLANSTNAAAAGLGQESQDLFALVIQLLREGAADRIEGAEIFGMSSRVSAKIATRLERIRNELKGSQEFSILGVEGFADA